MPHFGKRSTRHLITCHPNIQLVMNEAIKLTDFSVICGRRSKEDQNAAFNAVPKNSFLQWPDSSHNVDPDHPRDSEYPHLAHAVDIVPYPIDWENLARFRSLAEIIKEVAEKEGVKLHWGFDLWDWDFPHWQMEF